MGDLFDSFDFDRLPNAVNMPTYVRLCAFLREDLKCAELVPSPLSVREVVEAIKKFNTSGTLCWLLAQETWVSSSALQDGLGDFGSTQRVFAHCAKAVSERVETAVATIAKEEAQADRASGQGDGGSLEQWLAGHNLTALIVSLQKLGVHVLEDLPFGIREGDITVDALVDAGAMSRLQARRLMQAAAALLHHSEA